MTFQSCGFLSLKIEPFPVIAADPLAAGFALWPMTYPLTWQGAHLLLSKTYVTTSACC